MGLMLYDSERATAQAADVVVLAVKPRMLDEVLERIAPVVDPRKLVITIAAGKETG